MTRWLAAGLALVAACRGVSPLTNRVPVGERPFLVVVGEGPDRQTDLFALPADGGVAVRFTFSPPVEAAPSVHPAGTVVAFLRRPRDAGDSADATLVVMNLINAAERDAPVPRSIGVARRVGWNRAGDSLFVLGDSGLAASAAPPASMMFSPVTFGGNEWAGADTATSILLGEPAFARVETCANDCISSAAMPWCVVTPDGVKQGLGRVVSPLRWGADSLAYVQDDRVVIRPLGPGRARVLEWTRAPARPRDGTYWEPGPR